MMESPHQALVVGCLAGQQFLPGCAGGGGGGGGGSEDEFIKERIILKIEQCFILLLGQLNTVLERGEMGLGDKLWSSEFLTSGKPV